MQSSFNAMDEEYLDFLNKSEDYFPDKDNFLNAFKTLSLQNTKYILFGQDPYPRKDSAIGYSFIDGRVNDIFDCGTLSKEVNKATSLRNFIKMSLLCEGLLCDDFSKEAILKIDKSNMIKSISDLRKNFEKNGVLLLNMALIFTTKQDSKKHIKSWEPFVKKLLWHLKGRDIKLILFGNMAKALEKFDEAKTFVKYTMPHPYNLSFITDQKAHEVFKDMNLVKLA